MVMLAAPYAISRLPAASPSNARLCLPPAFLSTRTLGRRSNSFSPLGSLFDSDFGFVTCDKTRAREIPILFIYQCIKHSKLYIVLVFYSYFTLQDVSSSYKARFLSNNFSSRNFFRAKESSTTLVCRFGSFPSSISSPMWSPPTSSNLTPRKSTPLRCRSVRKRAVSIHPG